MPAKSNYTNAQVAQYLRDHAGVKFAYRRLVKEVFHCSVDDMKATLAELVATGDIQLHQAGSYQYYFVPAPEKVEVKRLDPPIVARQYKQGGAAWAEVMRKVADYRKITSLYAPLVDKP